jgi:hypothetical protein
MGLGKKIRSWLDAARVRRAEDNAFESKAEREDMHRANEERGADARTARFLGEASMKDVDRLGD